MTATEHRIRAILTDILGIDPDKIELSSEIYSDLGADSLDEVEIVMACEEEFGVAVSDEDVAKVKTVADMVALANRLTAA